MAMEAVPDTLRAREEEYRQLLMRLSGVFAANVHVGTDGTVTEVHILGSSLRNPKQIMRDVQSALASAHGLAVDHRVISIAQLREDPVPQEETALLSPTEVRLLCHEVTESVMGDRYNVKVVLRHEGDEYEGTGSCYNTGIQKPRAVAGAVLHAVHRFLGIDNVFALLDVQLMRVASANIALVVVEAVAAQSSPLLVGAADTARGEALSVARATLDSVNRRIAWLAVNTG